MSDQPTQAPSPESIASACPYCGKENPDRLLHCGGCGTYLSSEEAVPKKSPGLAVLLVICLGPLGLLYVSVPLGITTFCIGLAISFSVAVTSQNSAIFFMVGYRIFCAFLAIQTLRAKPLDEESHQLLEQAARLEKLDPMQAIVVYEEIISRFPNSGPSKESARNISVLKKKYGQAHNSPGA